MGGEGRKQGDERERNGEERQTVKGGRGKDDPESEKKVWRKRLHK
jgi:hypothetical protein